MHGCIDQIEILVHQKVRPLFTLRRWVCRLY